MVELTPGDYPSEIEWSVDDATNHVYHSSDETELDIDYGCHTLYMKDSFGDGWNGGTWTLKSFGGVPVAGPFTFSDGYAAQEAFCVGACSEMPVSPEKGLLTSSFACSRWRRWRGKL